MQQNLVPCGRCPVTAGNLPVESVVGRSFRTGGLSRQWSHKIGGLFWQVTFQSHLCFGSEKASPLGEVVSLGSGPMTGCTSRASCRARLTGAYGGVLTLVPVIALVEVLVVVVTQRTQAVVTSGLCRAGGTGGTWLTATMVNSWEIH